MANNEFTIPIPARLKNVAKGGHVAGADQIIDDALGKEQSVINQEVSEAIEGNTQAVAAERQRAEAAEGALDNRLSDVEELAEISIDGGEAKIATGEDFHNPTAEQRAKIPTVGAILDGADDEPTAGSENLIKSGGVAKITGYNIPFTTTGKISEKGLSTAGEETAAPWTYLDTKYYSVSEGRVDYKLRTLANTILMIAFYSDRNENSFISGIAGTGNIATGTTEVPVNAKYLRYCSVNETGAFIEFVPSIIENIEELQSTVSKHDTEIESIQEQIEKIVLEKVTEPQIYNDLSIVRGVVVDESSTHNYAIALYALEPGKTYTLKPTDILPSTDPSINVLYSRFAEFASNSIDVGTTIVADSPLNQRCNESSEIKYTATNQKYLGVLLKRSTILNSTGDVFVETDIREELNEIEQDVQELQESIKDYSDYNLYVIGDSLSAGGQWPYAVRQKMGITYNVQQNYLLSAGGTMTAGLSRDSGLWRTKKLIDSNFISDDSKAVIIFENVNDAGQLSRLGNENDTPIIPRNFIEGYSLNDWGADLLNSIPSGQRETNAVIGLESTTHGKNLKITTMPSANGNITLKVGWTGDVKNYSIYVTTNDTRADILNKILEYDYIGIVDVLGNDNDSVDFAMQGGYVSGYQTIVEVVSVGNTGMAFTVSDTDSAKYYSPKIFIGDVATQWSNVEYWEDSEYVTLYKAWRSCLDLIQKTYPNAHVFISIFPRLNEEQTTYLLDNGTIDIAAFKGSIQQHYFEQLRTFLIRIANEYSVQILDVAANCGISMVNANNYYPTEGGYKTSNVHPTNEGYAKMADYVATELESRII